MAFGLTTATPLQRALCRTLDGGDLGDLAEHPDVLEAFGEAPTQECRELVLLGGIRGAKSLIAAAAAVRCTQRVDLSGPELRQEDVPRVSICSLDIDKARVVMNDHLIGTLERSPFLRSLFVSQSDGVLVLRHPSGRPVEIAVSAGKRAGGNLVSRWSAGCIFDEAGRMTGANEGVVNLDHARTSVMGRLLPGSMLILPTSPWAPFGPVYELCEQYWGKPTKATVVARCRGPLMNPLWWTPERCEELRQSNIDSYTTDVQCEFLAPISAMFSLSQMKVACSLPDEDEPYNPLASYVASMDPATRGNGWTLTISTRTGDERRVVAHRERRGTPEKPLEPDVVLVDYAKVLKAYGLDWCFTDQWYIDAIQKDARKAGITLVQLDLDADEKTRRYLDLQAMVIKGLLKLPDNAQIRADMLRVERHVTPTGIRIVLPKTADGRHCDYAPAIVVAATHGLKDVRKPEPVEDEESKRTRERALARLNRGASW